MFDYDVIDCIIRGGSREMQAEELERRRDTVDELPFSANTRDTMNAIRTSCPDTT